MSGPGTVLLVLPHQLLRRHPGLEPAPDLVALVEDPLFFKDEAYPVDFHYQKLVMQRASMVAYREYLDERGFNTDYHDWHPGILENVLEHHRNSILLVMDPVDFVLERRIRRLAAEFGIRLKWLDAGQFINTPADNTAFGFADRRRSMAGFYKHQRCRLDILMDEGRPAGGRWSFDAENRRKIPKRAYSAIPDIVFPAENERTRSARRYVEARFPAARGARGPLLYPSTFGEADSWLERFLDQRLAGFGPYEDAMVPGRGWLYHGVLTPMLNSGLLTPGEVVRAACDKARADAVPLQSLEGFVRQIIGWREFMRAAYDSLGVTMRNGNHWQHHHDMPRCFWDATTGIAPLDDVIDRVLETGYCHHIERLMLLGGFMFLCEIRPDEIYNWFMSLFVDACDWVMVPNVYAMSQNSDGGLITTKPYFSGSNYLRRMGYDLAGDWQSIWDSLYWRWVWNHRQALSKNPRWAMMCRAADNMDGRKLKAHRDRATAFLESLHGPG